MRHPKRKQDKAHQAPSSRLLRAALRYAKRGWAVFPLEPRGKRPLAGSRGHKEATTDPRVIRAWWAETPEANIGIRCDSVSGPVVIDLDGPGGEAFITTLDLPDTLTAASGRTGGRHWFFGPPEDGVPITRAIRPFGKSVPVDILGDGGYVVATPSVHPDSGRRYSWTNDAAVVPFPSSVLRRVRPLPPIGAATAVSDLIPMGTRDQRLTSLAGTLRRKGLTQTEILTSLSAVNQRCEPPLPEEDLHRIAKSIGSKPTREPVDQALEALNQRYAVIQIGKDVVILQRSQDDRHFELLSERSFRLLHKNQFMIVPGEAGVEKRVSLTERWLTWEHRRQYARLDFQPGEEDTPEDVFNVWRGWALIPDAAATCTLLLAHLKHVVCHDNDEHYGWLLDWLADILQNPKRKLGHLVALRGAQGTGKSLVGNVMERILGVHHVVVEKPEHVTGRFNAHLALCLLLQAEEAFWGGDKRARAVLKHLVSGRSQQIERKGIDAVPMPNYTRLLITSNEEWVWPTELSDRRLVLFDLRSTYRGNVEYFDALFTEIESGGASAFMHHLLHREIDEGRLRVPPTTAALREQAQLTMPAEESWLLSLLKTGELPAGWVDEDGRAHVPSAALHESYAASVPRGQFVKNREAFGTFLKQHLPRAKDVKYRGPARYLSPLTEMRQYRCKRVQSRGRVIVSLNECRRRFSGLGRAAPQTWGKPHHWRIAR